MKVCPNCGKHAERGNYCPNCGTALEEERTEHTKENGNMSSPNPRHPRWPWFAAIGAVLVLAIVITVVKTGILSPGKAHGSVESITELSAVADSFEDRSGHVPAEKVEEAITAVYESAVEMPGVARCTKDEYGVFIEMKEGLDYVYNPPVADMDQGNGELKIITMQPYYSQNKRGNADYDHDGLDVCAAETKDADERWSFSSEDNVDDNAVSLDRILALDDYKMILWQGHGGYTESSGYYLCTNIEVTDSLIEEYHLTKRTAVLKVGGNLGLKPEFFQDFYPDGAFENAFIYMATCFSGKTTDLAQTLVDKGAAVVFVNSESIYREYNLNMLHLIVESFCVGQNGPTTASAIRSLKGYTFNTPENWTISDSLYLAKTRYGEKDPRTIVEVVLDPTVYLDRAEVYYIGQPGVDRMTYAQWMSRFPVAVEPDDPEPAETVVPSTIFNDTFWSWTETPGRAGQSCALFHADGTFERFCEANGEYQTGTYVLNGSELTIDGVVYDYRYEGKNEFISREKIVTQGTHEASPWLFETDGSMFNEYMEQYRQLKTDYNREISGEGILIRLRQDGFEEVPEGVLATVDIMGFIEFDDAYVRSLKVGDVIDLTPYDDEYELIVIERIRQRDDRTIEINCDDYGSGDALFYVEDENCWRFGATDNDYVYTYVQKTVRLLFDGNSKVFDGMNFVMSGGDYDACWLSDIREYTDYHYGTKQASADVRNGIVSYVNILYDPMGE